MTQYERKKVVMIKYLLFITYAFLAKSFIPIKLIETHYSSTTTLNYMQRSILVGTNKVARWTRVQRDAILWCM